MIDQEPKIKLVEVIRLTKPVYDAIEKQIAYNTMVVGKDTSPLQAGWMLGAQAVLKVLRDGYTIEV